jgi:hypothetical protein
MGWACLILDGRVDPDRLLQIEEELIDDHLFGHLPPEDECTFKSEFLCSRERTRKVEFARSLLDYAIRSAPESKRGVAAGKLRGWFALQWSLPLAGALACALVATIWLGERDLSLSRELARATQANDEHERMIASMAEEQKRRADQSKAPYEPTMSGPAANPDSEQAAVQPVFHLSPGVSRGLTAIPVLHLSRQASTLSIVLELPFDPVGKFSVELLNSESEDVDKIIWREQFSGTKGIASQGSITITLPAKLLSTGEYRLRVEADASGAVTGGRAIYLFRVYGE